MVRFVPGVKTMARAFISHPGTSQKSSMQNVERGHKECTQVWCYFCFVSHVRASETEMKQFR